MTGASGTVLGTSPHGPSYWKVTEVADLRGDRLLVVEGELDIATAPELVELLTRLRRRDHAVVLDLSGVTFMDSTGLTVLMDARSDAESNGWSFEIGRTSAPVRRVFELAGVGRLLDG